MTWIIVSLVLGLIALIGYSIYYQRSNTAHLDSRVNYLTVLVLDVLNEHLIITTEALTRQDEDLQKLQDVADVIRRTTDATHLRHIDRDLVRGLYAPSTTDNDRSIFDVVDALVKDLEVAKAEGRYAPSTEGSVQPVFDTVDTQVQDLETSKAPVPATDPAAWGGPQQAVPEDPWKNAR